MIVISGNTSDGSLDMVNYEKCSCCGYQKKSEVTQDVAFSPSKCEKCESSSMRFAIGATNPPAWWKP